MARQVVDPRFAATLREIRNQRGISLRKLEGPAWISRSVLSEMEAGKRAPTVTEARRLDEVLDAGGRLAELVADPNVELDEDRLQYAARFPRRIDTTTLAELSKLLAAQRRLDDTMGSAAVLGPARAQLDTMTTVVGESFDGMRPHVLDVGAQWAQFVGWLHAANGEPEAALVAFNQALEWSTERLEWPDPHGARDMIATALSFKGYVAEGQGHVGSMIGLSKAAQRDSDVFPAQRSYSAGQEARGHAIVGEEQEAITRIGQAAEIATAQDPAEMPPWSYYYTPEFMQIQRGIIFYMLGEQSEDRNRDAIELLRAGLTGLDPDARRAEWAGVYLSQLAEAHARAGEMPEAEELLQEAAVVAATARSPKVRERVRRLARKYPLSVDCP